MDIEELSKKIDAYQKEEKKSRERDNKINTGWISVGLGFAVFSNYFATYNTNHVWFALFFLIIGFLLISGILPIKIKKRK
jgi:uncharacterized membrane protein HdeD (DUF308 family)